MSRRVLIIGDIDPPTGGVATYCRNLANGLAERGWEVILADTSPAGNKEPPVGARIYCNGSGRALLRYAPWGVRYGAWRNANAPSGVARSVKHRVKRAALEGWIGALIARYRPTVVLSNHASLRSAAAARVGSRYQIPVAVTIHGSEFTAPQLVPLLPVAREACMRAAAVTANSRWTAAAARERGVSTPIEVIPLGVDHARFSPGIPSDGFHARYGLDPQRKQILFAGWLIANKGPQVLLDAFARLPVDLRRDVQCVCPWTFGGTFNASW